MTKLKTPIRTGNWILDRLPEEEYYPLLLAAEIISLRPGQEIYRQHGPLAHVYFPLQSVISVVILMEEGKAIETASIGHEGVVGLYGYLGLNFSPFRSVSQGAGEVLRIPTPAFLQAIKPGGVLDQLLRRFISYSLQHAAQTIACNALHSVEERLCRWLLMTHDRSGKGGFALTHEFLAEMLGVRRQTVTGVAGSLQKAGLLTYRRGVIQVLNRHGLEAASCECYQNCKDFYDLIMRPSATSLPSPNSSKKTKAKEMTG
jgi:CRP-like cAMP-binding protein